MAMRPERSQLSAKKYRNEAELMQSATEQVQLMTGALQSAPDKVQLMTECLQSATDKVQLMTECLQSCDWAIARDD